MERSPSYSELMAELHAAQARIAELERALPEAKTNSGVVDPVNLKPAEEELKKAKEWLYLAHEAADIGIWQNDLLTGAVYFDECSRRHYGFAVNQVTLVDVLQRVHPEDAERLGQEIAAATAPAGRGWFATEYRVIHPDGTIHWLAIGVRVWFEESGATRRATVGFGTSQDITERKQLDITLQENTLRLSLALSAAKAGIWEWNLRTNQNIWSDELWAVYGLEPHSCQPSYESWRNTIHPEDRVQAEQVVQAAAQQATELKAEWRVVDRDGSIRWLMSRGRPILDAQGQVERFLGVVIDITERKRAENELRLSETRYRLISENAADVIWVLDPVAGKFTYVSPSVEKLRGYTPAEVMAQPVTEALTPESLKLVSESMAITLPEFMAQGSGTRSFVSQVDQPCKDGSLVNTEVTTTYLFNEQGQVEVVGVSRNITERKKIENELRQSEENFSKAFKSSPTALMITRLADGQYLELNEAYCAVVGYERAELMGHRTTDFNIFLAPTDRQAIVKQLLTTGSTRNLETNIRHRSGTIRHVVASQELITFDGEPCILTSLVDITERKQAEAKLRISEAKFKAVFVYAPIGISLLDANRRVLESNEALEHIIRFNKSQLVAGAYLKRKYIREDGSEILTGELASTRALVENRPVRDIVNGIVLEDDQVMWTQVSAAPLDLPETRVVVITQDITQRKQAEAKIRESEARFSKIFHASAVGINIFGLADNRSVEVNDAFLDLTGYTRAEVVGHTAAELNLLVNPAAREGWIKALREHRFVRDQDIDMRRKNGEIRNTVASIDVIDINDQPMALVIFTDITERKQAEEKLRERNEELEQLLNFLPAAVWVADDPECLNIRGNRYANELLRVPENANVSQSAPVAAVRLRQFSQGRELGPDELPMQAAARTGQPQLDFELRIEHPNLVTRTLLGGAVPLFAASGQTRGAVAVFFDITERKRVEEELRRSNAELEQFAYVASHDLQEPLRAVAGMVQLLGQRYKGKLDERADEYIDHAVEASARMKNLINDLLDYSRVGRFGKPFEPIDTQKALGVALANLQVTIQETQAQITHDDFLPTVMADPGQLAQILQNLIANAIKFRGEQPPRIHLSVLKVEDAWRFAVSDNGIGIDPQYSERIFLVFQRLHTRREYPGTGIGLSLCKKIIERHGGQIWVESQPGQGSTFYFTLPERNQ